MGLVTSGGFNVLGNDGRCSLIGREAGFANVGADAQPGTSTHGNEASFEFLVDKDPDYHLQCRPGYHRDSLSSPVAGAKPESGGHPADVKKLLDITGTLWYVVCLPEERAGKSYEPSEKTEHAQEPR